MQYRPHQPLPLASYAITVTEPAIDTHSSVETSAGHPPRRAGDSISDQADQGRGWDSQLDRHVFQTAANDNYSLLWSAFISYIICLLHAHKLTEQ